ncbi:ran-binding protein 3-like isoform X2 [Liolophura sinensis]|uniref:ran-binding protein 3-like isoform X2 n=1 Tax=Liolophura sinensis TaxID=3198878 RepID=UPI0031587A53
MEEPRVTKSPDSRVLAAVENNRSESNGSAPAADSSTHGNKAVFGSTSFGSSPTSGPVGSSVISPSSFGSPGHGTWQPSYCHPTGNPFAEKTSLKQPGVSRSGTTVTSQPCEGLIAPSRLNTVAFSQKHPAKDSEDDKKQRPVSSSILTPPKILIGSDKKEVPSSAPKFSLRPSVLSPGTTKDSIPANPLLKPATLPSPSDSHAESEEPSTSDQKSTTSVNKTKTDDASCPDSSNNGVLSSETTVSLTNPVDSSDAIQSRLTASNADGGSVESSSDGFVFGQNLADRVMGVSSSAISSSTPAFGASNPGNSSAAGTSTQNSVDGFVFGQNLADRVVNADKSESEEGPDVPDTTSSTDKPAGASGGEKTALSLEESAREYQAKHGTKPELEEVEVKTGEEEESNVLQANCKLFVFENATQTWIERGRGQLRLNDMAPVHAETFHSRLVMRTQGSLRLILNTKIWAGMTVERASSKSIRVTASDGEDGIKVFLITATPKDSENILSAIDWRVQRLQVLEEQKRSLTAGKTSEKRKADKLDPETLNKKQRKCQSSVNPQDVRGTTEESNDSSLGDPETEASNESHCSSLTGKSEDE